MGSSTDSALFQPLAVAASPTFLVDHGNDFRDDSSRINSIHTVHPKCRGSNAGRFLLNPLAWLPTEGAFLDIASTTELATKIPTGRPLRKPVWPLTHRRFFLLLRGLRTQSADAFPDLFNGSNRAPGGRL